VERPRSRPACPWAVNCEPAFSCCCAGRLDQKDPEPPQSLACCRPGGPGRQVWAPPIRETPERTYSRGLRHRLKPPAEDGLAACGTGGHRRGRLGHGTAECSKLLQGISAPLGCIPAPSSFISRTERRESAWALGVFTPSRTPGASSAPGIPWCRL
jgi:hypothetical protein